MGRIRRIVGVMALTLVTALASAAEKSKNEAMHWDGRLGQNVDILSDTQGVNFRPYLTEAMREIDAQWAPLVPQDSQPGATEIRVSVKPDGSIAAMHMDGSTQDDVLNRAAWGSLTGIGHLPPLPAKFHGSEVEMRIHFVVNPSL